jgi:4-hydroxythreonine-4-phosphate dehydrogenase
MGDPAGVGPQITWKAWAQRQPGQRPFYVIADPAVMRAAQILTGMDGAMQVIAAPGDAASAFATSLPVLPIACRAPPPGKPDAATAPSPACPPRSAQT